MQLPAHRDEPGVRYVTWSLIGSVFIPGVAIGIAYPTLPQLERVLGLSPAVVGLIISTTGAVRLLCNASAGSLFDRIGTRRPLLAGFGLVSVAPFGYVIGMETGPIPLDPAVVFLVARAVAGIGTALVVVGTYATVTAVTTSENRGTWLGYMLGSYGLGFPVGMIAGGIVADASGIQTAFLVAGCLGFISMLIVILFVPDWTREGVRDAGIRAIPGLIRADRRLAVLGAINGLLKFLTAAFLTTVVLFSADLGLEFGGLGDVGVSGIVLALSALAASAANLVAGRYSDSIGNRVFLLLPSLFAIAVGFVIVATVPTLPGVLLGGAISGIGGGVAGPVLFASLGDISPSEDIGKLGGAFNAMGDLGGIIGPIVALPAASNLGFDALYLVCAGLSVVTAVIVAKTLLPVSATPNPTLAE